MKIRRLEIAGFKSFLDRTVFEFRDGVTAIVGPNGCGKSNIFDAIKWVAGEQSAKELRGSSMDEVIFYGGPGQRSTGYAQVDLILSNEDGSAPYPYSEYTEITVTRRLYQSGESEYLINRIPCRRKDILDLISGLGIGKYPYSIIEQGKVEALALSRPQERRLMIEEAAGISRYRVKKEAALKKLEEAKSNLTRLGDIISEVKKQMDSLRRQARVAEKYKEMLAELRELEKNVAAFKYRALEDDLKRHQQTKDRVIARLRDAKTSLSQKEVELEELKLRSLMAEKEISEIAEKIYSTGLELQKTEGRIEWAEDRTASLTDEISKLRKEINLHKKRMQEAKRENDDLIAKRIAEKGKLEEIDREISVVENSVKEKKNRLREIREKLERDESNLKSLSAQLLEMERKFSALSSWRGQLLRDAEEDARINKEKEKTRRSLQARQIELRKMLQLLESRISAASRKSAEIEEEIEEHQKEERRVSDKLAGLNEEIARYTSRLESLEETEKNKELMGSGVRFVFENAPGLPLKSGVLGTVSDIIATEPPFETAVEAALGEKLACVLMDRREDAEKIIKILKDRKAGRASFLPMDSRRRSAAPSGDIPATGNGTEGVIGLLSDLVTINERYAEIIRPLLQGIIVASDLETAFRIWENSDPPPFIVTLEGEVLSPQGVVTGGAENSGSTPHLLARKREIGKLRRELDRRLSERSELERARTHLVEKLSRREEEHRKLTTELERLAKEKQQKEKILIETEAYLTRIDNEAINHTEAIEKAKAELNRVNAELEDTKQQLEEQRIMVDKAQKKLSENRKIEKENSEGLGKLRERLAELKVERSSAARELKFTEISIKRTEKFLQENEERSDRLADEVTKTEDELASVKHELRELKKKKESLLRQRRELQHKSNCLKEEHKIALSELEKKEGETKEIAQEISSLENDVAREDLEISRCQLEMKHLEEYAEERFFAHLPEESWKIDTETFDIEQAEERIRQLKDRTGRFGDINLVAAEEYRKSKERFDELSRQKSDLETSVLQLEKSIEKLDSESKDRFLETFRSVKERFQEVFPALFERGSGTLILTDEKDPLNAGVEMEVQPFGKRVKSLSLLSGGEKALCVIAFIFSLFLARKGSTCFLDEVDAPLDDVNIHRFIKLIKKYEESTQFILITHNKKTMEAANTLYGVTMEGDGVSKLVSVRLD